MAPPAARRWRSRAARTGTSLSRWWSPPDLKKERPGLIAARPCWRGFLCLAGLHLFEKLGQAVDRAVAVGDRLEDGLLNDPGLVADGLERCGLHQHVARRAFVLERRDDSLG